MAERLNEEINSRLQAAQCILLVSHIRPDGDAVGSMLGLGLALERVGKNVQMVLADGLPSNFRFLEGASKVRSTPKGSFDLVVVLDCSDLQRVGGALQPKYGDPIVPDLNIDHHITNLNFADLNLVEVDAAATTEILAQHMPGWGLPIDGAVATALLTGLLTDTIGFRTSNVTAETLRTAALLMEGGAPLSELYYESLVSRSYEAAQFWGLGLSEMQREGGLVWTTLTQEARDRAGYSGRDDADLTNILSSIEGAAVALVFVEQPNGSVKVSWRAKPGLDVAQVAFLFGGGGHRAAAGAEIEGSLDEVQAKVIAATRGILSEENT